MSNHRTALWGLAAGLVCLTGCTTMLKPFPWQERANSAQRKKLIIDDFDKQRNEAQLAAAVSRYEQGETEAAIVSLLDMKKRQPNFAPALSTLADIYMVEGRTAEALELRRKLVKAAPDNAEHHHSLAILLESSGELQQALFHFDRAIELDSGNPLYQDTRAAAIANTAAPTQLPVSAKR